MREVGYYKCVDDPSHLIAIELTPDGHKKLAKKFRQGYRSCPNCKQRTPPENNCMVPCEAPETENRFASWAVVACRHGHTTQISAFANGMLHVKWGEDGGEFENVHGSPEHVPEMLDRKAISCNHTIERRGTWQRCGCKLKAMAGKAETPQATFIKTTTRVGDIWDKAGVAEPVKGDYDKEGYYRETEFERRNARRMKDMRRGKIEVFDEETGKRKFVKRDRVAKEAGKPMSKPSRVKSRSNPEVSARQAKRDQ